MKVTSVKTITLTRADLKDAVMDWVYARYNDEHSILMMNDFEIDPDSEEHCLVVSGDVVEYDSKDLK